MKVSGVYAILGPTGVYVGESSHCWARNTLGLAVALGLDCGIVREMPGASRLARVRVEADVAGVFAARGFLIVSKFLGYAWPQQYRDFRKAILNAKGAQPKITTVTEAADGRLLIQTSPRRASAIIQVLAGGTLAEVGKTLGISRERVRQYLKEANLTSRIRVIQYGQSEQEKYRFSRHGGYARRSELRQTYKMRAAQAVAWLREFAASSGRAPTYGELYMGMFGREMNGSGAAPRLSAWFGSVYKKRRVTRRLHALYHMAGLHPRESGFHGAIRKAKAKVA